MAGNHDASALPVDEVHQPGDWMHSGHPSRLGLGDAHDAHFRVSPGIGVIEDDIPTVDQAAVFRGGVDPGLTEHRAVQNVPFPIDLEHPAVPDVGGFVRGDLLAVSAFVSRAAEEVDTRGIRLDSIQLIANVGEAVSAGVGVMANPLDLTVEVGLDAAEIEGISQPRAGPDGLRSTSEIRRSRGRRG